MARAHVAVMGIGSLRAGPHIAAALAACPSDIPLDIRLWDGSAERLDLFDRFLRVCLQVTDYGHEVRSFGGHPADALTGATAVILALHEDGARRHLQPTPESMEDPEPPSENEESMSIIEFGLGDPNRPTPQSRLSPTTRSVVFQPDLGGTREEVILRELEMLRPLLEVDIPVLNLIRAVAPPDWLSAQSIQWPEALTEAEIAAQPHQVLRWIQGDPSIAAFIEQSWSSPVSEWLKTLT